MSLESRFWPKVLGEPNSGCWLWMAATMKNGYGVMGSDGGHDGMLLAHRVSWELHNGPIPDGLCVLHKCDVRSCVNPGHLFLGTNADNTADMVAKGRGVIARQVGERNGNAKLNSRKVVAIRSDDRKYKEIAAEYGVSIPMVGFIKRRKNWAHVLEAA